MQLRQQGQIKTGADAAEQYFPRHIDWQGSQRLGTYRAQRARNRQVVDRRDQAVTHPEQRVLTMRQVTIRHVVSLAQKIDARYFGL